MVPNCTPYLLWVKRVWSIFFVFFIHMCLIDWAACFCLRSRLLGALVKVTPSKVRWMFWVHQVGLLCRKRFTYFFLCSSCLGVRGIFLDTWHQW